MEKALDSGTLNGLGEESHPPSPTEGGHPGWLANSASAAVPTEGWEVGYSIPISQTDVSIIKIKLIFSKNAHLLRTTVYCKTCLESFVFNVLQLQGEIPKLWDVEYTAFWVLASDANHAYCICLTGFLHCSHIASGSGLKSSRSQTQNSDCFSKFMRTRQ